MPRLTEHDIITPTLLRRFELEGEFEGADGRHYALILRDDGVSLLSHHPGSPGLDPAQMLWAGDVLRLLNRELHHDGAWVVAFTNVLPVAMDNVLLDVRHAEYGRYALLWLDQDGDVQFTVEWEQGVTSDLVDFAAVLLAGIHSTVNKCEAAWATWHLHMREVLEPTQGQTFKRAKGERPPSATRH